MATEVWAGSPRALRLPDPPRPPVPAVLPNRTPPWWCGLRRPSATSLTPAPHPHQCTQVASGTGSPVCPPVHRITALHLGPTRVSGLRVSEGGTGPTRTLPGSARGVQQPRDRGRTRRPGNPVGPRWACGGAVSAHADHRPPPRPDPSTSSGQAGLSGLLVRRACWRDQVASAGPGGAGACFGPEDRQDCLSHWQPVCGAEGDAKVRGEGSGQDIGNGNTPRPQRPD